MKKVKSVLILILAFLIIYFLQVNFFTWFNIRGIMPNLFVIFVLYVGLCIGQKLGAVTGLVCGLFIDILIGRGIGFTGIFLGAVRISW